jgi:hypothetical protein
MSVENYNCKQELPLVELGLLELRRFDSDGEEEVFSVKYQEQPNVASFEELKQYELEIQKEVFSIKRSKETWRALLNTPKQEIDSKFQEWFKYGGYIKIVKELFPVNLPKGVKHIVIWINPCIQDSTIAEHIIEDLLRRWGINPDDYIIWHRRERNGTVPSAIHYHVYCKKNVSDTILNLD